MENSVIDWRSCSIFPCLASNFLVQASYSVILYEPYVYILYGWNLILLYVWLSCLVVVRKNEVMRGALQERGTHDQQNKVIPCFSKDDQTLLSSLHLNFVLGWLLESYVLDTTYIIHITPR